MGSQDVDKKDLPIEMYEHSTDDAQHAHVDSVEYTDAEASAIVRKIDRRLLPVLTLLYLLSFLDRGNGS